MNKKQVKEFSKEFKSLNSQIQSLLIKYGAGPVQYSSTGGQLQPVQPAGAQV